MKRFIVVVLAVFMVAAGCGYLSPTEPEIAIDGDNNTVNYTDSDENNANTNAGDGEQNVDQSSDEGCCDEVESTLVCQSEESGTTYYGEDCYECLAAGNCVEVEE